MDEHKTGLLEDVEGEGYDLTEAGEQENDDHRIYLDEQQDGRRLISGQHPYQAQLDDQEGGDEMEERAENFRQLAQQEEEGEEEEAMEEVGGEGTEESCPQLRGLVRELLKEGKKAWRKFIDCPWKPKNYLKAVLGVGWFTFLICTGIYLSDEERRADFQQKVYALGWFGNILFTVIFALSVLPFGPYMELEFMIGFLYNVPTSMSIFVIGNVAGIWMTAVFANSLMRKWFDKKIKKSRQLQVLIFAVQKNAVKLSLLTRFIPVPIGITTGVLAIGGIPHWINTLCGTIAYLPENFLIAYTSHQLSLGISADRFDTLHIVFYVGAAVLFIAAFVLLAWLGKSAMSKAEAEIEQIEAEQRAEQERSPEEMQHSLQLEQEQPIEEVDFSVSDQRS